MGTYVTDNGFVPKTVDEVKTALETALKNVFGTNIDLDPSGTFGQLVGVLAYDRMNIWQALQEVYNTRNVNMATGVSLDNICAENGLVRLAAIATTCKNVFLVGVDNTIIAAGKLVSQGNDSNNYSLDAQVTLIKTACQFAQVTLLTVSVGTIYTVAINTINNSYTAIGGDTIIDVLEGIQAQITINFPTYITTINSTNNTLNITESDTDINNNTTYSITVTNITLVQVGRTGNFTCTNLGAITLPANTLTTIVTPVTGWNSVNNPTSGITGVNQESDDALRLRRLSSLQLGNATEAAIRKGILENVPGVVSCNVTSNRTNVTDIAGRPPKSFECIVAGGEGQLIANEIWARQPAGIQSYGLVQTYTVLDSQGNAQPVWFSVPINTYIWVKVTIVTYYPNQATFPSNGADLIKQAIVDWSLINATIGKSIYSDWLYSPVFTVPGLGDVTILIVGTANTSPAPNPGDYLVDPVILDSRHLAVFSIGRITVVV